jgi:starch-binding outer membrane protein, SusD/RagB family
MKKLLIPVFIGAVLLSAVSCRKQYLDLLPEDQLTEASYFTTPEQFKYAANNFYNKMISWQVIDIWFRSVVECYRGFYREL